MPTRFKCKPVKLITFAIMLFALLATSRPPVANAQTAEAFGTQPSSITSGILPTFTSTADPLIQQRELAAYVRANKLSTSIAQLNLGTLSKISQYTDIDSSANGFGYNACGLVAAAAALGSEDWPRLVGVIADAAGDNYSLDAGIQPSKYVAALQKVFGLEHVVAMNSSTLGDMYRALSEGKIVIVDIQVNALTELPSVDDPNYAHFARILGIDVSKHEIYIQNTLSGDSYWTLSLTNFVRVWDHPETTVSLIPDPQNAEPVTRWMVILDNEPVAA